MQRGNSKIYLLRYKDPIQAIPIFLLALSCGVSSGILMTLSVLAYFIICYFYHEKIGSSLLKSRLFLFSLGTLLFWLFCLLVPMYWTGGKCSLLSTYLCRALPLILVCLFGKKQKYFFQAVWLGLVFSIAWYDFDTVQHPVFREHRLLGSFGSWNSLAAILCMLLPSVTFGIIRYGRIYKKISIVSAFLCILSLGIIILTGSRNGWLTTAASIFVLVIFLVLARDKFFLKLSAIFVILGLGAGICLAPPQMVSQRVTCNIQNDGRVWLFQVAGDIYKQHPNIGIGLGNWGKVYRENYQLPGREKNMDSPHNIFLQTLNESGRIGLLGFLMMFFFQFATLLHNGFIQKKGEQRILCWSACVFLMLVTTVIFGMMDYDFFGRHVMQLFWFYWGLAVYEITYRYQTKLEIKPKK